MQRVMAAPMRPSDRALRPSDRTSRHNRIQHRVFGQPLPHINLPQHFLATFPLRFFPSNAASRSALAPSRRRSGGGELLLGRLLPPAEVQGDLAEPPMSGNRRDEVPTAHGFEVSEAREDFALVANALWRGKKPKP